MFAQIDNANHGEENNGYIMLEHMIKKKNYKNSK